MKTLSKNILIVLSFLLSNEVVYTQCNSLIINAGNNQAICSGQSVQIGGNPTISNTLINSSRSIIFASKCDNWIDNAAYEAQKINNEINNLKLKHDD